MTSMSSDDRVLTALQCNCIEHYPDTVCAILDIGTVTINEPLDPN